MPARHPVDVLERYLDALASTRDIPTAIAAAGGIELEVARQSRDFRIREAKAYGKMPLEGRMYEYLECLYEHCGNYVKAAKEAGTTYRAVDEWKRSFAWFAEAEQDVMNQIIADVNEQNVRLATGNNPKVKDGQHLRWFMAHTDRERWGEQPKTIEHRYSGSVDMKMIDAQILELLEDK